MQPRTSDAPQIVGIVGKTGASAAHRERRPHHYRVVEFFSGRKTLVERMTDPAASRLGTDSFHDAAELLPVLASLDRVDICTNQLHVVLGEDARPIQCRGGVQSGLTAQGGQQCVGAFLGNNPLQHIHRDRFDIGGVSELRVRHDRGRIAVDQHHP